MRFLFAAILFLLAVAAFTFVAKVFYLGTVEGEFERASSEALRHAGFEEVTVDFDHHDASVSGFVDSETEKATVLETIRKAVPIAHLPEAGEVALKIRPSVPPEVAVTRDEGSATVLVVGALGAAGEEIRELLGSRIQALETVEKVDNRIEIDPRRLPMPRSAELVSLATELLRHSGESAASLRYRNGVLELSGVVDNDGLEATLRDLAGQVEADEVREAIEVARPVLQLRPSTLLLTRNRFGVSVSGSLAGEESRSRVLGALASLEKAPRVTDRLEISEAVGAGPWEEKADTLLPFLLQSLRGEATVEIGEEQIRLSGRVESDAVRQAVLDSFAPLQAGESPYELLADVKVDEGPDAADLAELRLLAEYEDGLLKLAGILPDPSFPAKLEKSLEAVIPDLLIKSELEQLPGASDSWGIDVAAFFVEFLPRVETATIRLEKGTLHLEGKTLALPDRRILENVAVNSFPSGISVTNDLAHEEETFPQPELLPEARTRLAEDLKGFPVYFATNSEVVDEKGKVAVAAIAARLEEAGVAVDLVVTGFADNVGNAAYNRELSLRRADSVVKELVAKGISEDLMKTESRGEDVTNVARSLRWKARRVEVSLAPPGEDDEPGEGDPAD